MLKILHTVFLKNLATTILAIALFFTTPFYSIAQWSELGGTNSSTFNYYIQTLTTDAAGNLAAGGFFTNNTGYSFVAKWNGSNWGVLGGTGATFNSGVNRLTKDGLGNIYATGGFTNGSANRYVAKWNGSKWAELGGANSSTFNDIITSVAADRNGNVYAGGYFTNGPTHLSGNPYIAKWNGTGWIELGGTKTSTINNSIEYIITDAIGSVYAAGNFMDSLNKYYVAKWNGTKWIELGGTNLSPFNSYIKSLANDNKGNLYAVGAIKNGKGKEYVAKWNGTVWGELGGKDSSTFNDAINTIITDTKGNVYIAGNFTNNTGKQYVAKWDGIGWTELGGTNSTICNNIISSLTTDSIGNVYASGKFTNANGKFFVAKYTYPIPTPVNLTNFSAKPAEANKGEFITLTWQTASETNSSHFIIERSKNVKAFSEIGTVKAVGNGANRYTFHVPISSTVGDRGEDGGMNYFRLKMIDKDGSSSFSKTVSVQFSILHSPFSITPNPAHNTTTVTIQLKKPQTILYQLINAEGKPCLTQEQTLPAGNSRFSINLQGLAKGIYWLYMEGYRGKQLVVE